MLDSQLIIILGGEIRSALNTGQYGQVSIVQKGQPTQEGVPTEPTIFFEKLFDLNIGWPMAGWLKDGNEYTETVEQLKETQMQISALRWQDPSAVDVVTASDMVDQVNLFFTLPSTISRLRSLGVSILRVKDVRNPYMENDKHQFEAHPSFDLIFTHSKTIEVKIGAITSAIPDITLVG